MISQNNNVFPKPTHTQVKRLTMGLLRSTEDSRPLVHNNACSPKSAGSMHTISDGYVNEAICEADLKLISAKFGDSCRKSLTSVMDKTSMLTGGSLSGSGNGVGCGVVGGLTVGGVVSNSGISSSGGGAHDACEFDIKKNFLRETSSGKFLLCDTDTENFIETVHQLHTTI